MNLWKSVMLYSNWKSKNRKEYLNEKRDIKYDHKTSEEMRKFLKSHNRFS